MKKGRQAGETPHSAEFLFLVTMLVVNLPDRTETDLIT